jgi:cellulose synthase/poly-beta-1,6-N-acetylglucosamine synthase-like glycosyltransferase
MRAKQGLRAVHAHRHRLALLLPAHNEEIILATTIRSAIEAGQLISDIYVVDDASTDKTWRVALSLLPKKQVLKVRRSGKALAVRKAIKKFFIVERYTWIHIADADSIFCSNYFRIYRKFLNAKKWSAAVGFVQSMRGNWIATYRSFSYTYGQHIFRRIQSWFGVIAILPGPVTSFKTDIITNLNFATESLTEDFDLTLQIHRKHLGRIRFIPEAVNYTQDPQTLKDFYNQSLRWQRGFFQGLKKYRIGLRLHMIDFGIGYQISESVYYFIQLITLLIVSLFFAKGMEIIPTVFGLDFTIITILAIFSAFAAHRPIILISLTYFYILRFIELAAFVQGFFEVIVLRKFKSSIPGWETTGRRYIISSKSLKDI